MSHDFAVTNYGRVRADWKRVPLTSVAFFQEGPGLRKWQWTDSGMKVINGTNVLESGEFDVDNTNRFIALDEFRKTYSHFAVEPDDIVVVSSGSIGKVSRVRSQHLPLMMNTSVIRFHSADRTELNDEYLYGYLRSPLFQNQAASLAIGSAQLNFGPIHLKRMEMPLPPIPTQQKIAAILSAYDDLIENNKQRIKLIEEMARRIYREWFVDFRYPGHQGIPLVDSEVGAIPSGWTVASLSSLATVVMGQSPPSSAYNREGIGLPFHQGVGTYANHFPVHEVYSTVGVRLAEDGDILVSVRAPVGRINIADRRMILGRGLCGIRAADGCREFLLHALKEFFREEDVMGSGTIFQSVTRRDVEGLQLVWPGGALAEKFVEMVEPLWRQLRLLTVEGVNLRATCTLLLPRLVSGEIDVTDLDIDTTCLVA